MERSELARRLRLVVITDAATASPRSVEEVVRDALRAGAPAVQLRDKAASAKELLRQARALREITAEEGALFFVNDRLDVALASDADGVHLGPSDIPVAAARAVVPTGFLIGCSSDDPVEAARLVEQGASYVGCGTVYPTASKADAGDAIGTEGLARVVEAVNGPVVGIGGITPDRAAEVADTSASGLAAIGAVMAADDVRAAVTGLMRPWAEISG